MKIKFFAPIWGNVLPFDRFCEQVKAAGYDGVEMHFPLDQTEKQDIISTLEDFELESIGQYWQSIEKDFETHKQNFEKYLSNLIEARPLLINCQTGKDYFSFEKNIELFQLAKQLSDDSGISIIHETHRGKSLFAAHITSEYLKALPDLKLCLDVSHWCNVHESLLADQEESVLLAIHHTSHIHSRVGHPEGPQVSDPRAPEWRKILNAHLLWWDKVVANHQEKNTQLTITTEFGPANYLPVLPYSQIPVAIQWDINVFILNLLKERYGQ